MYLNGRKLKGIEQVTQIHHTTVMRWIRSAGHQLPNTPEEDEITEISDLERLQIYVDNK